MTDSDTCPGCGLVASAEQGATHAYMISSAACWRHYSAILGREYSTPALMPTHFLTVDAFAVQHPGDRGDRRARQSVWLHLAGLHAVLRQGRKPEYRYALLNKLADADCDWPDQPDHAPFPLVAGDICVELAVENHIEIVRRWADTALASYEEAVPGLATRIAAFA